MRAVMVMLPALTCLLHMSREVSTIIIDSLSVLSAIKKPGEVAE
jgi:hypothetical protein